MSISESCEHDIDSEVMLSFDFDQLGVPVTLHKSAVRHVCKKCGMTSVTVPYPERLAAAAAVYRCGVADKLLGQEIRFLRKSLAWTAAKLAEKVGVTPETISRWENDKAPMGPAMERILRMLVVSSLKEKAPAIDIDSKSLIDMKIKAIRSEHLSRMDLALVFFKEDQNKTTEEYSEPPRKAA